VEGYVEHMKKSRPGTACGSVKFEDWHGDGKSQSKNRNYSVYQTKSMKNTSGVYETKVTLKDQNFAIVRHKSSNWDASGELIINAMLKALAAKKSKR
jgi:hypothetical protein